jgi:hypothetical protein
MLFVSWAKTIILVEKKAKALLVVNKEVGVEVHNEKTK